MPMPPLLLLALVTSNYGSVLLHVRLVVSSLFPVIPKNGGR
jgi:hypothetical protein